NAPFFPRRANIHFVQVVSPKEVITRTWERGSGITLACGTGASAVCVAGVLTGRTGRELLAHLPGGDLRLEWSQADNHVFMTGPAVEVFSGEWPDQ
ncbi:MAG TPA: diaminopimelate epimerase, partial [Gemmataceae bacterium]|nr:diaminopimelate epimerase [Gemmataceae bacterium]